MRNGWATRGGGASSPDAKEAPAWPRTRVSADASRLSRTVGHGLRIALDAPGCDMFLEILTPAVFASHDESEKVADAMRGTVLNAREGRLILGVGGLALLCLLGGVPWTTGGSAKERLRAAAAVARLPSPLAALDFSLARMQAPSLSPIYRVLATVSAARAARHEVLVRQRLHARRDDVSCYCEAWAPARVWDALARGGMPAPVDGARTLPDALLPLRLGFVLGHARVPRSEVAGLRTGDVVRMPSWLGVDGTGVLALGALTVGVRVVDAGRGRAFEVTSVTPRTAAARPDARGPFALTTFQSPRRSRTMNPMSDPALADPFAAKDATAVPSAHPDRSDRSEATESPAPDGPLHRPSPDSDLTRVLDDMSVALSAEVGILRMSVAALRAMAPGTMLEIEAHALGEVVLRTEDGQHLAGGRLVDIDGRMGIQITKLGTA